MRPKSVDLYANLPDLWSNRACHMLRLFWKQYYSWKQIIEHSDRDVTSRSPICLLWEPNDCCRSHSRQTIAYQTNDRIANGRSIAYQTNESIANKRSQSHRKTHTISCVANRRSSIELDFSKELERRGAARRLKNCKAASNRTKGNNEDWR